MVRRAKRKKVSFFTKAQDYLLNSQTMPLVFVFAIIGILFVLIRMKGIEQDYKLNEIEKQVKIHKIKNKELKALRARELSIKKLKAYAKKFNLSEPDEKRVIIVP